MKTIRLTNATHEDDKQSRKNKLTHARCKDLAKRETHKKKIGANPFPGTTSRVTGRQSCLASAYPDPHERLGLVTHTRVGEVWAIVHQSTVDRGQPLPLLNVLKSTYALFGKCNIHKMYWGLRTLIV